MKTIVLTFLCYMFLGVPTIIAGFVAPIELIKSERGVGDLAVGISRDQYGIGGGNLLQISEDGMVIIGDEVNCRIKIYGSNGNWIFNISPKLVDCPEDLGWPEYLKLGNDGFVVLGDKFQKYDLSGNLIYSIDTPGFVDYRVAPSGIVYYQLDRNIYQVYSPTGELLATYDEKPLELGVERSHRSLPDNQYLQIIEFEDVKFAIVTTNGIGGIVRDSAGFLYGAESVAGIKTERRKRVHKFDKCSRNLGYLDLPEDDIRYEDTGIGDAPTTHVTVIEEYGPPVIGPDGSVYAYKRTPDTYSILKWTWVDSPDDPQPGPDAPANLTVQPSIDGLYLTWGASPQDPGCVDGYEVERSTSAGGIYTSVKATDPGVLKFNDTGALPGSTYFYKVRAKSGSTYSPYTAEMSGTR